MLSFRIVNFALVPAAVVIESRATSLPYIVIKFLAEVPQAICTNFVKIW